MSYYYKKTPFFLRWIYSDAIWRINNIEKVLYLTFDDGPTEGVTNFVLEELEKYNARVTFFCVGYNAERNLELLSEIRNKGHVVGNHSYSHYNGFRTKRKEYVEDVERGEALVNSNLFRPPYGKMKWKQYKTLKNNYTIVMWDVMAGDFDESIDADVCFANVVENAKEGSIVVFHDTEKAFPRLKIALPRVLKYYSDLGYKFEVLPTPITTT